MWQLLWYRKHISLSFRTSYLRRSIKKCSRFWNSTHTWQTTQKQKLSRQSTSRNRSRSNRTNLCWLTVKHNRSNSSTTNKYRLTMKIAQYSWSRSKSEICRDLYPISSSASGDTRINKTKTAITITWIATKLINKIWRKVNNK